MGLYKSIKNSADRYSTYLDRGETPLPSLCPLSLRTLRYWILGLTTDRDERKYKCHIEPLDNRLFQLDKLVNDR